MRQKSEEAGRHGGAVHTGTLPRTLSARPGARDYARDKGVGRGCGNHPNSEDGTARR